MGIHLTRIALVAGGALLLGGAFTTPALAADTAGATAAGVVTSGMAADQNDCSPLCDDLPQDFGAACAPNCVVPPDDPDPELNCPPVCIDDYPDLFYNPCPPICTDLPPGDGGNDDGEEPGDQDPGDDNPGDDNPGDNPGDDNPGNNPGENPGDDNPGDKPGDNPGGDTPGDNGPGTNDTTPTPDSTPTQQPGGSLPHTGASDSLLVLLAGGFGLAAVGAAGYAVARRR